MPRAPLFIKWPRRLPREPQKLAKGLILLLTLYSLLSTLAWIWERFMVPLLSITWYRMGRAGLTPCGFVKLPFVQITATDGVMLMWETNCRFDHAEIYYSRRAAYRSGPHQQLRQDEGVEHRLAASSIEVSLQGQSRFVHRAYLEGLHSDSYYDYSVLLAPPSTAPSGPMVRPRGPATPFQATFYFGGERAERLTLGVLSDNHQASHTFGRLLRLLGRRAPEVLVHLGDMVHSGRRSSEWQTCFFDPLQRTRQLASRVPALITMGNHDLTEHGVADYFATSDRVGNRQGRYYYSVTLGPLKMIVLDCTHQEEAQLAWLETVLAAPATQRAPFRVVLFHTPPFIEFWEPASWQAGGNQWSPAVRARLVAILERHHVDLVLSGHQHNYQRGFKNGIHYVVCGGAGGIMDRTRIEDHGVYKKTLFVHHYLLLHATPVSIEVHAYDQRDRQIDYISVPRNVLRRYRAAE